MKVVYLNVEDNKDPEEMNIEDSLQVFYSLINCRTVDMITRTIGGKDFTIICDDEGPFKERPQISAVNLTSDEMLVGNLIITGMPDDDGELIELTDDDIKIIFKNITPKRLFGRALLTIS